jgi:hypothetical protein
VRYCIHCGKSVLELLPSFLNGGPIHSHCFSLVQKDLAESFKKTTVLVEDARGVYRLREVAGRIE